MDGPIDWREAGVTEDAFWRYVREQIFTLPGVERPEDSFTVLLTGSRAMGAQTPRSDVDFDVVCPEDVYRAVHAASVASGLIPASASFYLVAPETGWERYFGGDKGRPHVSVTSIAEVERQFRGYEDVPLWIWTRAKVAHDPGGQFQRVAETFRGYPRDVLARKIKYRVLMAWYWDVAVFPYHERSDDRLLAAATAVLNSMHDLLRVFFLVEGTPFPYTEQLYGLSRTTRLGRQFREMFKWCADLVTGNVNPEMSAWDRISAAHTMLCCSDLSEECRRLDEAVDQAMLAAGIEPEWVAAGYRNIDELLLGSLGPPP
jgi:hypothetical protein